MIKSDRHKGKYFCGFMMATIIPLSLIVVINPQPLIAQESRVENQIIYVDSQQGNDSNQGTRDTPLKTITHALKIAQPKTVISLAPGTYNEATGEIFPLIIKDNVTLKGLTGGQGHSVMIEGSGSFLSHSAAEQNVTIAAIKNAEAIAGVTVTNPDNRGHGLWIESASPQVSDSTFSGSGNTGLSVNGNSKPIITNNYFHNNGGNGLLVYGTSAPQVRDNTFESTGFGVSIVQNAAPVLENNNFQGNRIGVILEGKSQGMLRNNTIINSLEYGLVAIAESQVDLGVSTQPGNNIFRNNQKLDIQNITTNVISATGTEFNGQVEGKIDFSDSANSTVALENVAVSNGNSTAAVSRLRQNPLPNNNQILAVSEPELPAQANPPVTNQETLPPPPPIANPNSNQSGVKEYVFSAPEANEISNINSGDVSSLSDLLASPTSAIKYRVLVEANSDSQQAQVKSLYPQAFSIVYQGQSMLQVGAFSDRTLAETTSRSLADLGLNAHILE